MVVMSQPTPFAIPVAVQRYRMEYAVRTELPHVWMPVPRYWDGNGVRQLSILDISPPPTDRYRESNGTEIVFWDNPSQATQTFELQFDAEVGFLEYGIDESREWPPYDVSSSLYQKNTVATTLVQVDHPEIRRQAGLIVGAETNPYRKAQLIHWWVNQNIDGGPGNNDALSTLRDRIAGCNGYANLFVALCRASGVPARNVAGICAHNQPTLQSGNFLDGTLGFHTWAEFYLPELGWIQVDPTRQEMFASIPEPRLVTSKGNDIRLRPPFPDDGEVALFHLPMTDYSQIPGCWLVVTHLP